MEEILRNPNSLIWFAVDRRRKMNCSKNYWAYLETILKRTCLTNLTTIFGNFVLKTDSFLKQILVNFNYFLYSILSNN